MRGRRVLFFAMVALAALASEARAHGEGVLVLGRAGRTVLGTYDSDARIGSVRRRPYASSVTGIFDHTDMPGWNVVRSGLPAGFEAPPAGLDVGFRLTVPPVLGRNFSHWEGAGAVAFGPPPGGIRLLVQRAISGGFLVAVADGGSGEVPGFTLFTTATTSSRHDHVDFFLLEAQGSNVEPPNGVYLASMRLTVPAFSEGDEAFLLFGKGVSQEALDAASAWVEDVLIPDCSDRGDNDGDGLVDFPQDLQCATAESRHEDADSDADGIADTFDNCVVDANADQRDTDADGFGNACDPDLDDNGVVNFADLARLRAVFFTADLHADLDGNGAVNFADLARLRRFFFQAPGPSALRP